MKALQKRLLAWLSRLRPEQTIEGDANVQVGQVQGPLTVDMSSSSVVTNHHHQTRPTERLATVQSVLHLLDQLDAFDKRRVVLDFMHAKWGTRWVRQLDAQSLQRTNAYAQGVLRKSAELAQAVQHGQALRERDGRRE